MPRGQKKCENCGEFTGPRSRSCPKCHHSFIFKVQSKEQKTQSLVKNFNWKELECGDKIKVNGGPYYMNSKQEFISMGYRGKFIVQSIDGNGILAYSNKGGFCYIYMGIDFQDKETNIFKTKHKILKIKKKTPLIV